MSDPISRLNAALEGRYRIERQLGEGGMAAVYLADDEMCGDAFTDTATEWSQMANPMKWLAVSALVLGVACGPTPEDEQGLTVDEPPQAVDTALAMSERLSDVQTNECSVDEGSTLCAILTQVRQDTEGVEASGGYWFGLFRAAGELGGSDEVRVGPFAVLDECVAAEARVREAGIGTTACLPFVDAGR